MLEHNARQELMDGLQGNIQQEWTSGLDQSKPKTTTFWQDNQTSLQLKPYDLMQDYLILFL